MASRALQWAVLYAQCGVNKQREFGQVGGRGAVQKFVRRAIDRFAAKTLMGVEPGLLRATAEQHQPRLTILRSRLPPPSAAVSGEALAGCRTALIASCSSAHARPFQRKGDKGQNVRVKLELQGQLLFLRGNTCFRRVLLCRSGTIRLSSTRSGG